jgi:hypothetical protein
MAVLDTGSPFLVISNPNSDFCGQSSEPCSIFRSYDPTQSSSATWVSDDMNVVYELTKDSGSWFNDTLIVGDLTILNFPLGTANGSSTLDTQNWFGISGPPNLGPAAGTSSLQIMAQAGVLQSASIGIFSGPLDSSNGEVVFGGLDTSKWQGNLQILPIVENESNEIHVNLVSVAVSDSKIESLNLPVELSIDTGNFDIKLPQDIVDEIWSQVDGIQTYNVTVGTSTIPIGTCDCNLAQKSQTFVFGFDGISIKVPISDMVALPPRLILQNLGVSDFPQDKCVFMINGWGPTPPEFHPYILGDAFLRSAYYVVDWDSNEIALGQANDDGGSQNIIPIPAGTSGLRDAIAGTFNSSAEPSGQPSATTSDTVPRASSAPTAGSSSNSASSLSFSNEVLFGVLLTLGLGGSM